MRRVNVVAAGAVQGVFFRATTREEARRVGVTGWVRNRADGNVEAEFQGPADKVEQMVAFCRRGPGHARVTGLEISDVDPVPDESGFRVQP